MKQNYLFAAALLLITAGVVFGGAYQWGVTTIIGDSTDPVINEAATTGDGSHGYIAYGSGKPTVLCFVTENLGMQKVTAEIFGINMAGWKGNSIEKITLTADGKTSSTVYKYKGTFTETLDSQKKYWITYTATDAAGRTDTYDARITLIAVDGKVYVNDIEVTPGSTIYVKELLLFIEVEVTQGTDSVSRVYGVMNGEQLEFTASQGRYVCTYTLPGDGSYSFMVQILDNAGTDTQLASFSISLGSQYTIEIVYVVAGLLVAGLIYSYVSDHEKGGSE